MHLLIFITLLFLVFHAQVQADATQISAGLDGRTLSMDPLFGVQVKKTLIYTVHLSICARLSAMKKGIGIFLWLSLPTNMVYNDRTLRIRQRRAWPAEPVYPGTCYLTVWFMDAT